MSSQRSIKNEVFISGTGTTKKASFRRGDFHEKSSLLDVQCLYY